ncbi:unnamed protein product [Rangifer tarandus platyrhynchus]|uniref:Uncharacterized protein n=2 Tax=Rangifer tarandus platyrhynchus TaxID=3082113 RepID=A0ABN9A5L8_RANTA|nr:unnamed protein product [Rangifer tarandus platyrhynchus]
MLRRPLHMRLTHHWASPTPSFLGMLISHRWSFPSWVIQHNTGHAFICLIHNTMLKGSLAITPRKVTISPRVETRQCQVEQEQLDVFSAFSQLEDRGFRLGTRKLRRAR